MKYQIFIKIIKVYYISKIVNKIQTNEIIKLKSNIIKLSHSFDNNNDKLNELYEDFKNKLNIILNI